jgi:hypothetical protein
MLNKEQGRIINQELEEERVQLEKSVRQSIKIVKRINCGRFRRSLIGGMVILVIWGINATIWIVQAMQRDRNDLNISLILVMTLMFMTVSVLIQQNWAAEEDLKLAGDVKVDVLRKNLKVIKSR